MKVASLVCRNFDLKMEGDSRYIFIVIVNRVLLSKQETA